MSFRNLFKFVYFKALYIISVDKIYLNRIKRNNHLTILNLHRISNEVNPFYPSLTPKLFEKLLKYVTDNFNVITFNEINNHTNSIKPNLILSFDDGFYDFFENAMPILDKFQVKANLNVIPHCLETGIPVWDVLLGDILNNIKFETINSIEIPNFNMKLDQSNKSNYGLALTRHLKQFTKEEREVLWRPFSDLLCKYDIKKTRMLNKEDVINISKIHEIGVHSYTHESMAIESNMFFENDFKMCKNYFENTLKIPINIYAFPSGSYKNNQIDYLLNNGIKFVLLVDEKYSGYNNSHKFYRFTYYANSINEVKIKAVGYQR